MKVAFVKYIYDCFGPWSSIKWEENSPEKIFDIWPSKAVLWQATCLLKADWYIVLENKNKGDYIKGTFKDKKRVEIIKKYSRNIISQKEIPFHQYDIIISFDPILEVPKNHSALFVYYVQEHWDRLYYKSTKKPIGNYDLFLDHLLSLSPVITNLPQSISFPYLYFQELVKSIFNYPKEEKVFIDWRTLLTLSMQELFNDKCEMAAKRLEKVINYPVFFKGNFNKSPFGITDPPLWKDAFYYLQELAKCKYYIGVGKIGGGGQGLADAASVGCICIGDISRPYHKIICHPQLLCKSIFDVPFVFRKLINSPELQKEALEHQNKMLKERFEEEPLRILEKALEIKRKKIKK